MNPTPPRAVVDVARRILESAGLPRVDPATVDYGDPGAVDALMRLALDVDPDLAVDLGDALDRVDP